MPAKKRKTQDGSGFQIGGNVSVTHGDFVTGDKNVTVDQGGVYVGGDVQNGNIVLGDHNRVGNQETTNVAFFTEVIEQIEKRPKTSPEDMEDLKASVAEIKAEVAKGEQADESFLARRLRTIERIAPDISDIVLATLTNPVAGFAATVKKAAARAGKSASAR